MTKIMTIVLSAGEGKRMNSVLPKALHKVAGMPMVGHVLTAGKRAGADSMVLVTGPGHDETTNFVSSHFDNVSIVIQKERLGTGHAVKIARDHWCEFDGYVFVLYADNPLVEPETIGKACRVLSAGADIVVVGYEAGDPDGLGRLVVEDGELVAIREHRDASEEECRIKLCNSGLTGFRVAALRAVIDDIGNNNAQSEYYLTDIPELARAKGLSVKISMSSEAEAMGVNDRIQLALAEKLFQQNARNAAMLNGVTLTAPETVFFAHDTTIERDVTIEQNVVFGPGVHVKTGARILAFSHIEGTTVAEGAQIGPYARLRPGTYAGAHSKIGNFVEVKKSRIEEGVKINHLSYIGDAEIGTATNIGAGTVICNYDGQKKHETKLGNGAFIGSNSSLVAPLVIGDGAYVASGSVITSNVENDALALGRARQVTKPGYVRKTDQGSKNR